MLGLIVSLLVIGLVAGFIARAVVPGKQNLSIVATIVLGVVGSFVGRVVLEEQEAEQPAGIIGSIIGAIVVLVIWVSVSGRRGARR
jgi:uncharacterized membrane protein YeaQ/YmgE (transglycosylase-associated protein family)